ncbi:CRISPR-associated protein Cas4 [Methanonatronarchaeum sp. AMET-Sl]|uniref:CRISPR-associated protein Cas4 n=1 Tax=Methanonatronarchaeum sp. AMET-Sl TaxID=3037654 RepID=UPI00244E02B8|nr:CRISPR-associated protein Cas4 [Methanonatronarchaeum sp. AMET-Sl]WGI17903.1 CRISPR-associated protein Cas4 [Methanonatronarchaeum sp. AMET-Sl]
MNYRNFNNRVTGVEVGYYFICHTKLWLFHHNIQMEREHENVKIGKQLHEERYPRVKKELNIRNKMKLDFIERDGELIVHEIKKSNKMEKSHFFQMYFYLDYLEKHNVEATGEIHYPLLNKKKSIKLDENKKTKLHKTINKIKKIVSEKFPNPERKNICKKCAYEEFCFGTET